MSVQEPKEKLDKLHVKAGQVHWIEYSLEKGDAVSFLVTGMFSLSLNAQKIDTTVPLIQATPISDSRSFV